MDRDAKVDHSALPFDAPVVAPGDIIGGKYRIDAALGRGGMSVVYRATHLHLEQLVAIKILSAAALVLPEYVARLKREARAVSRIRSQHVVRIFDIGELPGGIPYLVMEHLTGADLAAVLARRGPLPVHLAVETVLQTCEALAEAHALGIVHRDLKPANLFLTEDVDGSPCVKVLDFGISRMTRRHALSPLTDPGTVLGTPSYMAPEQMEAADTVDARSDIWALGAILYELLVGHPPYAGESLPQIFMKIMRSKPPKITDAREAPAALDAIVARCLAIEAENRYASVAELAWALSLLGTPNARDSAARIARVFDRRSAESGGVGVRASVPPPIVRRPARSNARRALARFAGAVASAMLVGGAIGVGVLAVEHRASPDGAATAAAPIVAAVIAPAAAAEAPPPPLVMEPATIPQQPPPVVVNEPVVEPRVRFPAAGRGKPTPPAAIRPVIVRTDAGASDVDETSDGGTLAIVPTGAAVESTNAVDPDPAATE